MQTDSGGYTICSPEKGIDKDIPGGEVETFTLRHEP